MDLYNLKNNTLEPVDRESFSLEKDIQVLIENNVETLFNLEFISTEFTIGDFRLDSLCFDNETNSFVIIEYKKGSSYSVIDQGYSYMSVMLNNKSDFVLEYIEKTGKSLKKNVKYHRIGADQKICIEEDCIQLVEDARRLTCSEKCRDKRADRQRKIHVEKENNTKVTCKSCKIIFIARKDRLYCSKKCRYKRS